MTALGKRKKTFAWKTCKIHDDYNVIINELPVGQWTTPYKTFLETIQYDHDSKKNVIVGFTDNNTDEKIHFVVKLPKGKIDLFVKNNTLEGKLKLVKKIKISNMHLFNKDGVIQKFTSANEILREWYTERLDKYKLR